MTRLSMDLKVMSKSYKGHKFILAVTEEVPKLMIAIPIHLSSSEEIGDDLIEHILSMYSIPECMIIDHYDSAFMSS